MNTVVWLAVVVAVAVVAWQAGARWSRARYRRGLGELARELRAGELPDARGRDPGVEEVTGALRQEWSSSGGRREEAFMEALERISRYLRERVERPLLRGLEEELPMREAAEVALGGVEDLEFFLEEPGGEAEPGNLTSLVESATREFTREWDVTLRLQAPDASLPVRLDAEAFKDALYLVLHNAGHHGGGTPVEVSVEREGTEGVVRVRDRGPGFGDEALERAQEPFWTTEAGALGLGLPHARRLVESLDGGLEIRNAPDGGAETVVRVRLSG